VHGFLMVFKGDFDQLFMFPPRLFFKPTSLCEQRSRVAFGSSCLRWHSPQDTHIIRLRQFAVCIIIFFYWKTEGPAVGGPNHKYHPKQHKNPNPVVHLVSARFDIKFKSQKLGMNFQ
jgi:hypothetical protein